MLCSWKVEPLNFDLIRKINNIIRSGTTFVRPAVSLKKLTSIVQGKSFPIKNLLTDQENLHTKVAN